MLHLYSFIGLKYGSDENKIPQMAGDRKIGHVCINRPFYGFHRDSVRGRLVHSWRIGVEDEVKSVGKTFSQVAVLAQNWCVIRGLFWHYDPPKGVTRFYLNIQLVLEEENSSIFFSVSTRFKFLLMIYMFLINFYHYQQIMKIRKKTILFFLLWRLI